MSHKKNKKAKKVRQSRKVAHTVKTGFEISKHDFDYLFNCLQGVTVGEVCQYADRLGVNDENLMYIRPNKSQKKVNVAYIANTVGSQTPADRVFPLAWLGGPIIIVNNEDRLQVVRGTLKLWVLDQILRAISERGYDVYSEIMDVGVQEYYAG